MSKDEQTFEAMAEAYSADLYRFAYWLTKESALAEDMVQETFLRAWKALPNLRDPKAAKFWLFTTLRREVARHFSKSSNALLSFENEFDLELNPVSAELPLMDQLAIRRALAEMPVDYLEPLLLQVIGGYSCEEIAQLCASNRGTIMTRLCRARQKLRHLLEGEGVTKPSKVKL